MTTIRNSIAPLLLTVSLFLAAFTTPSSQTSPSAGGVTGVVEKYRPVIHEQMRKQGIPGFAIALNVLAFNFLGDGLRDILDPRTQKN